MMVYTITLGFRLYNDHIKEWLKHFRKLMTYTSPDIFKTKIEKQVEETIHNLNIKTFNELSYIITETEVREAIVSLKKRKAADTVGFRAEMLQAGIYYLVNPITKLLNIIYSNEMLPDLWRESSLTPIHKKGDKYKPENYRGIAVSNILYKVFCIVLNKRLTSFLDKRESIPVNQIGFKKNARTSDHILALKTIIDKYILRKPKQHLYVCFVDLKSAFDSIWRNGLLFKMIHLNLSGKFINMIKNIYSSVYYKLKLNRKLTDKINSNIGVKQGCIMSPTLFNIYLSDICSIFDNSCQPVTAYDIQINCLLYADDMVLLSESQSGLQMCLNKLNSYCQKWKLTVNTEKTKIMIFNKGGRIIKKSNFLYNNSPLEIVKNYKYLGLVFDCSGNFNQAIHNLNEKGKKALYVLIQKVPYSNVPINIKLFNTMVLPILTYGCEIWGPIILNNVNESNLYNICDKPEIEKTHLKFMKFILGVHSKSSNAGVRGELGKFPLLINCVKLMIKYWLRICKMPLNSIIYKCYLENKQMLQNGYNVWLNGLQNMLRYSVNNNIDHFELYSRNRSSINRLCKNVQMQFETLYTTKWLNLINDERKTGQSKLRTYWTFKTQFLIENYLINTQNKMIRSNVTKLRISSHKLKIELGRYNKPFKIEANKRFCTFCNNESIEDENHFMLICKNYIKERKILFEKIINIFPEFEKMSINEKFIFLLKTGLSEVDSCKIITEYIHKCTLKHNLMLLK